MEGEPSQGTGSVAGRPKGKKKSDVVLTSDQQEIIADMLKGNDFAFLYDKGRMAYRDARKREEALVKLAAAVDISGKCW